MNREFPTVLAIAGLDPSGGAGIQADIQTLSALQCHCTSVISTLTVQDSHQLYQSHAVSPALINQQLHTLAADFHFSAIKLGALGSADNAVVVGQFIQVMRKKNPDIAVVLDPVIKASGGGVLSDQMLQQTLLKELIPHCSLITPNEPELRALTNATDSQAGANKLAASGISVLITGGHSRNTECGTLDNQLFRGAGEHGEKKSWTINLIEGEFRGTGCTFSSAIAGYMAKGFELEQAITKAQCFLSRSLEQAYPLESGQHIPQRVAQPNL